MDLQYGPQGTVSPGIVAEKGTQTKTIAEAIVKNP
jgi:hypothetical protein